MKINYKVYLIKERKTKEIVYVGLTKQTLHRRFQQHVSDKKEIHHHTHCIELVKDFLTIEQAVVLEEMLIIQYQTRVNGLNISPRSINGYSNAHSEQQKLNWSLERKGKKVSEEHAAKNRVARLGMKNTIHHSQAISKALSKAVLCLNNGKRYDSARKAAKELNLHYSKISLVCSGQRPHTKGFVFKFCQ